MSGWRKELSNTDHNSVRFVIKTKWRSKRRKWGFSLHTKKMFQKHGITGWNWIGYRKGVRKWQEWTQMEKKRILRISDWLSVWGMSLLSSFKWNFRKTQVSLCVEAPKKSSKGLNLLKKKKPKTKNLWKLLFPSPPGALIPKYWTIPSSVWNNCFSFSPNE